MGCCCGKKKPPAKTPAEPPQAPPEPEEPPVESTQLFAAEKSDKSAIEPITPVSEAPPPDFRIGLGSLFPDFECRTTQGTFTFHSFLERQSQYGWTMLFSHPKDFTPVCTTELSMCQSLVEEFQRRSVQLIGLSCDSVVQHKAWSKDVLALKNKGSDSGEEEELAFPLIADERREIASMLGMLDPLEICNVDRIAMPARALFLIGPDKRNRLTILYPATTGRNFSEILRVVDSLHITHSLEVGTPADWHFGDDVMPAINVAEDTYTGKAAEQFVPSGRRYMRHIPQPAVDTVQKIKPHPEVKPGESDFKIKLGAKFPDFDWSATKQGINRFHHLLDRLKGDLTVMICWPRNFDPVATTELMGCLKFLPDLRKRNISLIGMSCDGVENLHQWVKDAVSLSGSADEESGFTMIADRNLHIAAELGFLPADPAGHDTCPVRALFVIGKDKTLRLSMQYPTTTGLNFPEILRVLDSLILTQDFKLATPANWQQGDRLILDPKVSKTDAGKYDNLAIHSLPSGKEYIRWVDCPKLKWFEEKVLKPPASTMLDGEEWEPLSPPKGQEIDGKEPPLEDKNVWCLTCGCGP